MREIAVGAVALLMGLIIGGVGPRAELTRMMHTVETVDAERCKNTVGEDLASFFGAAKDGGLPLVDLPSSPAPPRKIVLDAPPSETQEALDAMNAEEAAAREQLADDARAALENSEELDLARSALELRRAQSRQALIEQLDPDDEQLDTIEAAYSEMNETLEVFAGGLADMVLSGEEPDRRTAMEFAAEALDAMLVAEDNVLATLDEDQRAEMDVDVINPFNHVSPGLIDSLMELDETP
jgi:hypothetical protein